ncbi:hypothetical protein M413DRAFT_29725 [Hebeloma cylindrosporum]|uniref:CCHC-type domain-containing protein n=1 Tax=Hebeloma cylindrosporum TaxID=76867 RepID=A0A0C2YDU1_HEBCY|nr:hypothetical protein M413DRAFT_29725 [Hebeloma cylindrosporum h7]
MLAYSVHYQTAGSLPLIQKAFKPSTIISAFAKSGIWPLNPNAIPLKAYEPAKNTSTQAAMAIPSNLTPLLEENEDAKDDLANQDIILEYTGTGTGTGSTTSAAPSMTPSAASSFSSSSSASSSSKRYRLVGIPPSLPTTACRADLRKQIDELQAILDATLYHKELSKKQTYSSSNPRHMTGEQNMDELAKAEWKGGWKALLKEAGKVMKLCRKRIEEGEKQAAQEFKAAAQEAKKCEREAEKQRKEDEKIAEQERKKDEREAKVAEKVADKAADKAAKAAQKAAEKALKEAEKRDKQPVIRARGRSRGHGQGRGRGQEGAAVMTPVQSAAEEAAFLQLMEFNDEWETLRSILYDAPECPQPRPIQPVQPAEEETTVSAPSPTSASMDVDPPQPTEEEDTVDLEVPAPVEITLHICIGREINVMTITQWSIVGSDNSETPIPEEPATSTIAHPILHSPFHCTCESNSTTMNASYDRKNAALELKKLALERLGNAYSVLHTAHITEHPSWMSNYIAIPAGVRIVILTRQRQTHIESLNQAKADSAKDSGGYKGKKVWRDWSTVLCFLCKEYGHMVSNCPQNRKTTNRSEGAKKAEGEKAAAVTEFAGKASAVAEHEVNSTSSNKNFSLEC